MSPSPFAGLSRDQAAELLRHVGERQAVDYEESLAELRAVLEQVDPVQALTALGFYFLSAPEGLDRETASPDPVLEHHAEIVQALCLANPGELTGRALTATQVQRLIDEARKLALAFSMRRLSAIPEDATEADGGRLVAIETLRGQTQVVRNWGYPDQMRAIIEDIFEPFSDDLRALYGADGRTITAAFWRLMQVAEDRLNRHREQFRPVARCSDGDKAIDAFVLVYGSGDPELAEALRTEATAQDIPTDEVRMWLENGIRASYADTYIFTEAEIQAALGGADSERLLDRLSLRFGELADADPEHFFMSNPVWQRPFIRLENGEVFIPVLSLLASFILEIFERLIESDADLQRRYEDRRAQYLESEVERIMRTAIPDAQLFRGSKFTDEDGRPGENDLLVIIDQFAIIFEEKSGAVHPTARRGAERRLEATVERLIVEPSLQSLRFVEYLRAHPGEHELPSSAGGHNRFDSTNIRRFLRLTITLDDLAGLQARQPLLRDAGLLPANVPLAPTMTLVDLLIISELLETTPEKLHYLARRAEFEQNALYLGDESDLLAFYLETGFNVGEAEFDGHAAFHLLGRSKELDPYFLGWDPRHGGKKPKRTITKYWRDLIATIEERKFTGWCETALILLNVSLDDQRAFERGFKRVQQNVRRAPYDRTIESQLHLLNGPPQRRDAIVGIALGPVSREERDEIVRNAAARAIGDAGSNRALVLGVQVGHDIRQYPYGFAAVLYDEPDGHQHGESTN